MPGPDSNLDSTLPNPTSMGVPVATTLISITQLDLNAIVQASVQAILQQQLASTALAPPIPTPHFIGPPSLNPAAAESPALADLFPEVEAGTLAQVASHSLPASDLYKLDARCRDKSDRSTLELDGTSLRIKGEAGVKDYLYPSFIHQPLTTYFSILINTVPRKSCASVATATTLHMGQFLKLVEDYEWPAVLKYHMAFFQHRRREILKGEYWRWGAKDINLAEEHLAGWRRIRASTSSSNSTPKKTNPMSASEVCRNFNVGTCTTTPCRNNRLHRCSTCGNDGHGATRTLEEPLQSPLDDPA